MTSERERVEVSVIIPAYNEAERLPATLRRVAGFLSQRYLSAEVLVVDEDAGMTRVRNGDDFGWVVSDKVSDEDPAKKDGAGAKDEGAPPADP